MKNWRKIAAALSLALSLGMAAQGGIQNVRAEETTGTPSAETGGSSVALPAGAGAGEESGTAGDMLAGNTSDVTVSGVSVSGSKAGGKVKISFTVTGNRNNKKHYEVDSVARVYPVLNDSFPCQMDDEAYRVTNGSGNSVQCSYTFQAKDNLETGYYMIGFEIAYTRRNIDGRTNSYDSEYFVTKNINVKLTAKKSTPQPTTDVTAQDEDISLKMENRPSGTYGGSCHIAFTVSSRDYKVNSVVPVIDEHFPFESSSDAYKVTRSQGSSRIKCRYTFRVKDNVESGYQGVAFKVTYRKGGAYATVNKTVNVELSGKKKDQQKDHKKSTPRVMVTGYTTDVKKIVPNGTFKLTLQIKNNANKTVQNVKFTLSTANGEFLPVSGASTAFVGSIGAGGTVSLSFKMKAAAGLSARSYPVTVKAEYEDGNADSFNATDNVSIPVTLKDRISLTDMTPPDMLSVGGVADISFSINNMGAGSLSNVRVLCKGDGIECEEAFVGNIASGATGYASVSLTGTEVTPEDSDGECDILVKYENASGESKTYKEKTNIYVMEEMMDEGMMDGEMMMDEEGSGKKKVSVPLILGIAAVVIVAVIIVVRIIRKKRRLRKEEELMEDELL